MKKTVFILSLILITSAIVFNCTRDHFEQENQVALRTNYYDGLWTIQIDTIQEDSFQTEYVKNVIEDLHRIYDVPQYVPFEDGTYRVLNVLPTGDGFNVVAELEKYVKSGRGNIVTDTYWPHPQYAFVFTSKLPGVQEKDTVYLSWKK